VLAKSIALISIADSLYCYFIDLSPKHFVGSMLSVPSDFYSEAPFEDLHFNYSLPV